MPVNVQCEYFLSTIFCAFICHKRRTPLSPHASTHAQLQTSTTSNCRMAISTVTFLCYPWFPLCIYIDAAFWQNKLPKKQTNLVSGHVFQTPHPRFTLLYICSLNSKMRFDLTEQRRRYKPGSAGHPMTIKSWPLILQRISGMCQQTSNTMKSILHFLGHYSAIVQLQACRMSVRVIWSDFDVIPGGTSEHSSYYSLHSHLPFRARLRQWIVIYHHYF